MMALVKYLFYLFFVAISSCSLVFMLFMKEKDEKVAIVAELPSARGTATITTLGSVESITTKAPVIKDFVEKVPEIEDLVEQCMKATNISSVVQSPALLDQAKVNARYLYQEYRKVIPETPLDGYKSHCWEEAFSVRWENSRYSGQIGNWSFSTAGLRLLKEKPPNNTFESNILCLPNVFLAGFYKCGSTFVYCLLRKLINYSQRQIPLYDCLYKEPKFWVSSGNRKGYRLPDMKYLAKNVLYFLPGLQQIQKHDHRDLIMLDGSPNKINRWPYFRSPKKESKFTNYCLLPAVLPKLFPGSKFIVITRNPISLLYTSFWFSCTTLRISLPMETRQQAPSIFHYRIMNKIHRFNHCMRDNSRPSISHACKLNGNYSPCILQRLHLLEKCVEEINYIKLSGKLMPKCGTAHLAKSLHFAHIRKWLRMIPRERFLFLTLENLSKNLSGNAHDMLKFLDLNTEVASDEELIRRTARSCRTNPTPINMTDPMLRMKEDTRALLEIFFAPFNQLLSELLGIELPWS